MRAPVFVGALAMGLPSWAQVEPNKALALLYQEDQADRAGSPGAVDWAVVGPRDEARRAAALRVLEAGEVRSASDYHAAAMIFQHGSTPESIEMAYALARIGSSIAPQDKGLKWLAAAAWDRLLMQRGKPQWYGTQYTLNQATKRFELYTVDPTAVTDQERAANNVPSLAEAKARESEFNR